MRSPLPMPLHVVSGALADKHGEPRFPELRKTALMGLLAARMAAFSDDPRGGNPAGVVVGDALPPDD
ncbi:MAG: hypothetical protein QOD65_1164, partial [Gaiellales bacterium]|nr:hypothetical protein [Gaiellales bacterium]